MLALARVKNVTNKPRVHVSSAYTVHIIVCCNVNCSIPSQYVVDV